MPINLTKIKTYVGFAIKSKKILYGIDNILLKKSYLIIISDELKSSSKQKCLSYAESRGVPIKEVSAENVTFCVNREGVKAFAINDASLAKAILNNF